MTYSLGIRSNQNLSGVNRDLRRVVELAIKNTNQDFTVIEGVRSLERQKHLKSIGASKTLNSRHLTGHAVDIVPYPIPVDWSKYKSEQWDNIESAMKAAAVELEVDLEWGGDWKSFVDKPHWQLSRKNYN